MLTQIWWSRQNRRRWWTPSQNTTSAASRPNVSFLTRWQHQSRRIWMAFCISASDILLAWTFLLHKIISQLLHPATRRQIANITEWKFLISYYSKLQHAHIMISPLSSISTEHWHTDHMFLPRSRRRILLQEPTVPALHGHVNDHYRAHNLATRPQN
jgi:hypothetical protein